MSRSKVSVYAVVTAFICYVVITVSLLWFTKHAVDTNNHKFCSVLSAVTAPRPTPPAGEPVTNYGDSVKKYNAADAARTTNIQNKLIGLSKSYGCN